MGWAYNRKTCKCGQETHICAPWAHMGPWHKPECWLYAPLSHPGTNAALNGQPADADRNEEDHL